MVTSVYDRDYLGRFSRAMGNMLHDAVVESGIDGERFLRMFLDSGIAGEVESGNPKYLAGRSGAELFMDVMRESGMDVDFGGAVTLDRSDVYWVGWALAQYQWHSGFGFGRIIDSIPYSRMLALYDPLHEADVTKLCEVMDSYMTVG